MIRRSNSLKLTFGAKLQTLRSKSAPDFEIKTLITRNSEDRDTLKAFALALKKQKMHQSVKYPRLCCVRKVWYWSVQKAIHGLENQRIVLTKYPPARSLLSSGLVLSSGFSTSCHVCLNLLHSLPLSVGLKLHLFPLRTLPPWCLAGLAGALGKTAGAIPSVRRSAFSPPRPREGGVGFIGWVRRLQAPPFGVHGGIPPVWDARLVFTVLLCHMLLCLGQLAGLLVTVVCQFARDTITSKFVTWVKNDKMAKITLQI